MLAIVHTRASLGVSAPAVTVAALQATVIGEGG